MRKPKTIKDIYTNYNTDGGVFSKRIGYPWSGYISADELNAMYLTEYGTCLPSSYILDNMESGELPTEKREFLSRLIIMRFGKNWERLWATLNFDYDPIINYDLTETEKTTTDNTTKVTTSGTKNYSDDSQTEYDLQDTYNAENTQTNNLSTATSTTDTKNLTDSQTTTITNTNSGTINETQSVNAFNSTTAQPSELNVQTKNDSISQSSTDETTHTGTDSLSGTQTNTGTISNDQESTNAKTGTETFSSSRTETENGTNRTEDDGEVNRILSRKGNIGIQTVQSFILQERAVYLWDFFKQVFTDINKMLIIPIY